MKTKSNKLFKVFLLGLVSFSACLPKSVDQFELLQSTAEVQTNECIPPLETFSYSSNKDPNKPTPGVDLIIPPLSPWQLEIDLPLAKYENLPLYSSSLAGIRSIDGHTEIWIRNFFQNYPSFAYTYTVYYPDTQELKDVTGKIANQNDLFVSDIYVVNGSIWGRNTWGNLISGESSAGSLTAYPLMSKYDDDTQQFQLDQNSQGVPAGWYSSDLGTVANEILVDSDSTFWFMVHHDKIYSYDSATHKLEPHAQILDQHILSSTISNDGKIYYKINSPYPNKLFEFDPKSNTILPIQEFDPTQFYPNVFADSKKRLWLGGLGWRESDKGWYQLVPHPIFITNSKEDPFSPRWQTPYILEESSDGRLWFSSSNGMAWLDTQIQEWCWFTTYISSVFEDVNHNLWIIADGKLYKLALEN